MIHLKREMPINLLIFSLLKKFMFDSFCLQKSVFESNAGMSMPTIQDMVAMERLNVRYLIMFSEVISGSAEL